MATTRTHTSRPAVEKQRPEAATRRSLPAARRGLATRQRSWGLAAIAALLVIGFALGGAVLFSNAGDKVSVLALGSDVAKGQVVQRDDLRSVSVAGVAGTVPVTDIDAVVGKTAAVDLVEGQLVTDRMVTSDPVPGAGQTVVGLSLDPTRAPSAGLSPGDVVDVIAVPSGNAESNDKELDRPAVLTAGAAVYAAQGSGTSGGQLLLTIIVDSGDAEQIAAYSSAGRVAVVETAPGAGD